MILEANLRISSSGGGKKNQWCLKSEGGSSGPLRQFITLGITSEADVRDWLDKFQAKRTTKKHLDTYSRNQSGLFARLVLKTIARDAKIRRCHGEPPVCLHMM